LSNPNNSTPISTTTSEAEALAAQPIGLNPCPVVFGCSRTTLTTIERQFFKDANPFGFILFKRNCENPDQLRGLIRQLRHAAGRENVPIFIDQEGGRVSRLQPPHWAQHPPAQVFGAMYERDAEWGAEAMKIYARLVANELAHLGITVNCAPVLDLFIPKASPAIGDRAISREPPVVAALARIWAETFLLHGVLPVVKHLPGHGRMRTDPHLMLPVIEASRAELENEDFVPFELLKDLPIGMNSHAVFMALDAERPASLSPTVTHDIIRGVIGFDGLLLSDDICMKALHGPPDDLAKRALSAGSDVVLHCNGVLSEMKAIASVLEPMHGESWARWTYAQSMLHPPDPQYNPREDNDRLDILLGGLAYDVRSDG
jgi:beta-N-acetylhexosaminidase